MGFGDVYKRQTGGDALISAIQMLLTSESVKLLSQVIMCGDSGRKQITTAISSAKKDKGWRGVCKRCNMSLTDLVRRAKGNAAMTDSKNADDMIRSNPDCLVT